MYRDEEDQVFEAMSPERRARITMVDKVRRKWTKSLDTLLPTMSANFYQKLEISTPEGFEQKNARPADATEAKKIRSFLEKLAILLNDTKFTLPALIKNFPLDDQVTPSTLRDFVAKYVQPDSKTVLLLKAMHIGIVSTGFGLIKEYFNERHFPIVDIGSGK